MVIANSLYIHFPFCANLCNYCDFFRSKVVNKDDILIFQNSLEKSFKLHDSLCSKHSVEIAPLKTLYIGGGTPSLWSYDGVEFLKNKFFSRGITLDKDCEFTIEANPGRITEEELIAWKEIGVNRISMGLQSLCPDTLKALDRIHSIDDSFRALELMKKYNMNYSIDLMIGVPGSHKRLITNEVDQILKYNPSHISAYIFTVGKNYVHFDKLPGEDIVADQYIELSDYLLLKGFKHYEVSNFAKNGLKSKHNCNYWESKSVLALGPSATGLINLGDSAVRYKWKNNIENSFATEILNPKVFEFEKIYLGLRTSCGVKISDLENYFKDVKKVEDTVGHFVEKGLGESVNGTFKLNSKGFLVMDSFLQSLY